MYNKKWNQPRSVSTEKQMMKSGTYIITKSAGVDGIDNAQYYMSNPNSGKSTRLPLLWPNLQCIHVHHKRRLYERTIFGDEEGKKNPTRCDIGYKANFFLASTHRNLFFVAQEYT